MTIALIGAGVAGSACVSVLRSRGADFCIFEKSRGVGGRLTTRRVTDVLPGTELHYDHGAPVFSWSDALSQRLSADLQPTTVKKLNSDAWVACPSMPQLVKDLLKGITPQTQIEIEALEGSSGRWFLKEKNKSEGGQSKRYGPFTAVVFTAPAPQTRALLKNTDCAWKERLEEVVYDPCWALMATFNTPAKAPIHSSTVFANIFCQSDKPQRASQPGLSSWVAHASPAWSKAQLEADATTVQKQLLDELLKSLLLQENAVIHAAVHRWRYATVAHPLNCSALADTRQKLFFAGDACLGTGVAGATESGLSVAQFLVE